MDILTAAEHYHMFAPGEKVLVAVSGGPDSVAMLHALKENASRLGISLHVAHLNHGIRGKQSDLDQDFVTALVHEFALPATVKKIDIPSLQSQLKMGTEEAARLYRYQFLEETAMEVGADKIAVGHNQNDRAESVLLNIIRGSGINGLGSIRPVRGNIVRPLIDTPRSLIEAYIEAYKLPFRVDESNTDVTYTRNRIRHHLLPLLQDDYNPSITKTLSRLAEIAVSENDYLNEATLAALESIRSGDTVDASALADLPLALQRRALRHLIEEQKGDLLDVSFEHIDNVIHTLSEGADFTITLPSGTIYAKRAADKFSITRLQCFETIPFCHPLIIPGKTRVPEAGIVTDTTEVSDIYPSRLPANELILDPNAVKGQLHIRNVQPGDRISPFGLSGTKKIQDILVDKKIDRAARNKIAVLEDEEKILWLIGITASEHTRLTIKLERAIKLTVTSNK